MNGRTKVEQKGRFRVSNDVDAMGTHLVGYINLTYKQLVKYFGRPNFDDISGDDKVKIEWEIMFADGTVATIYDWKNYDMSNDEVKERETNWHIGGNRKDAVKKIKSVIPEKLKKAVEVDSWEL
jgi:hypothetical protein